MNKQQEVEGMTDLQFKAFVGLISMQLSRIQQDFTNGDTEKALQELHSVIEVFEKAEKKLKIQKYLFYIIEQVLFCYGMGFGAKPQSKHRHAVTIQSFCIMHYAL
jgi:hypothetical protein